MRRRVFPAADDPDYAAPWWLNPDFARLTRNRVVAKSRAGSISFWEVESLERTYLTVVGGFSLPFYPRVSAVTSSALR